MVEINNVIPHPVKETFEGFSQIWYQKVTFASNQFTMVAAPSGRGKSSLISIMYGLRHDYDGEVKVFGKEIRSYSKSELATLRQKKLSIIFQDLRLFLNLSGWENLKLKNDLTLEQSEKKILEMAERLGIKGILEKRTGLLSYGERQRIAIIRALIQPFELLLMDEPFSHLDENNATLASALIHEECTARGAGLLIASLGNFYNFNYHQILDL